MKPIILIFEGQGSLTLLALVYQLESIRSFDSFARLYWGEKSTKLSVLSMSPILIDELAFCFLYGVKCSLTVKPSLRCAALI